eukprot:2004725-Amphidinium_carterae.1
MAMNTDMMFYVLRRERWGQGTISWCPPLQNCCHTKVESDSHERLAGLNFWQFLVLMHKVRHGFPPFKTTVLARRPSSEQNYAHAGTVLLSKFNHQQQCHYERCVR